MDRSTAIQSIVVLTVEEERMPELEDDAKTQSKVAIQSIVQSMALVNKSGSV